MIPLDGLVGYALICVLLAGIVRPYRDQKAILVSVILVVLALHAVSFINVFVVTLPGAESDAKLFHQRAVEFVRKDNWPQVSIGTQTYHFILTGLYRLFGEYQFLGQGLSILAATGTLICTNRIAQCLGMDNEYWPAGIVLAVGFAPTFLLHNALILREPFELLGFAMGIFFVLKTLSEPRPIWFLGAAAGFLFMGVFHHVLLGVGFVLIGGSVVFLYGRSAAHVRGYGIVIAGVVAIGVAGYLTVIYAPATSGNDYVKEIRERGGIVGAIQNYRNEIERESPRTSYNVAIDSSSIMQTAKGLTLNYWNYLSRPGLGDLDRAADIVPFLSSLLRILLIAAVAWFLLFRRPVNQNLLYCAFAYFLVTAVWSLGTTNYGQAFRHHSQTDWLAITMAAYALNDELRRRRLKGQNSRK